MPPPLPLMIISVISVNDVGARISTVGQIKGYSIMNLGWSGTAWLWSYGHKGHCGHHGLVVVGRCCVVYVVGARC
jgi:hypothetical protein